MGQLAKFGGVGLSPKFLVLWVDQKVLISMSLLVSMFRTALSIPRGNFLRAMFAGVILWAVSCCRC